MNSRTGRRDRGRWELENGEEGQKRGGVQPHDNMHPQKFSDEGVISCYFYNFLRIIQKVFWWCLFDFGGGGLGVLTTRSHVPPKILG